MRLVMVPDVTRVARNSAPGLSWYGAPCRRSADNTSNSQVSRSCAAKAVRRARSRCLASLDTRLSTCSGSRSRSGRSARQPATSSSTSSRASVLRPDLSIRAAYLLTSRCSHATLSEKSRYQDNWSGTMWDPGKYRQFGAERSRPFYELVGRIGAADPRFVVDLGCGPGELTAELCRRWPGADVLGVD